MLIKFVVLNRFEIATQEPLNQLFRMTDNEILEKVTRHLFYGDEDEIKLLGLLVEQYLAFAETMANQRIPMYMKD